MTIMIYLTAIEKNHLSVLFRRAIFPICLAPSCDSTTFTISHRRGRAFPKYRKHLKGIDREALLSFVGSRQPICVVPMVGVSGVCASGGRRYSLNSLLRLKVSKLMSARKARVQLAQTKR